ncbi:MAG: glycyl-radical enzyme activating protein [Clostridia bacterium]|nr:glycyl-radical enzyme activating protein [Clostridia bacterium]
MIEQYKDVKGRIFDIQKFSVHDGPGIRTIVFLKGCFLRCKWCCNPESQEYKIQKMIRGGKETLVGKDVTVGEVMEDILKDVPYYRRSGGGVTLSGGESLAQPDFAVALLSACKEYGLHTAMETTGFADFSVIERFIPVCDLFLMDIKHTDSQKHKEFTTQSNEIILENAKRIAKTARELVIRVPVIPTFNDTPEEIASIAMFAKSLGTVKQLHLLPYHKLGYDKYIGLSREYPMGDIQSPSKELMLLLKETASACGLDVEIGG